ncbi:MAG: 50S ribosomal protein L6 [Nitrososphaeria archaeon]|nr:50S ribosomal protein L6 [Nitrososphaeria archaeon]
MAEQIIEVPENLSVKFENNTLYVKGPLGQLSKDFSKIKVNISVNSNKIKLSSYSDKRRDIAVLGTAASIIKNMFYGVTKGYTYKLKVVSAHFPVTIKVKGNEVHIENFYGEKYPRIAKIVGSCQVSVEGDDVIVKGVSKEDVGQTAANIERATIVKRKDQRVFLDGVYLYERS